MRLIIPHSLIERRPLCASSLSHIFHSTVHIWHVQPGTHREATQGGMYPGIPTYKGIQGGIYTGVYLPRCITVVYMPGMGLPVCLTVVYMPGRGLPMCTTVYIPGYRPRYVHSGVYTRVWASQRGNNSGLYPGTGLPERE